MNNVQRHAVVKFFEEEYGPDFAHRAKFGNKYSKPAVKTGRLLSSKKDLTKDALDFYLETMLSTMVRIRSLVPIDYRLPVVRKSAPEQNQLFSVCMINEKTGKSCVESMHFTEKDAKRQKATMDKLFDLSGIGGKREVRPVDNATSKRTYDVLVWDYKKRRYIPHPEFPVHETLERAIDCASHDVRCAAAYCIQWETWKAANCKAPEEYDYFEKENVLRFDKKALLKGHASPRCSDCWNLSETPYWEKLTDPNVDETFLDFCSKL